jgi:starch phosphorylase
VQLVIAGKAHPQDEPGKGLVREWFEFARRPEISGRVVFLKDYDMALAAELVQGVDVWINTPRRPWEASGTSGMKVLVNGGLNLSEIDGWWAEAYSPDVGWAIGDGREHGEDPGWGAIEAARLYSLLESDVRTAFYERDGKGLPTRWVARMRESMARLTADFSASRMVQQYVRDYHLPAATQYRRRSAERGALAKRLEQQLAELAGRWKEVRFESATVERTGDTYLFEATVQTGKLDPSAVGVELYAEPRGAEAPARLPLKPERLDIGKPARHVIRVPADRSSDDYTMRIVARTGELVPLEMLPILWQR